MRKEAAEEFGAYLANAIASAGYPNPTSFAREVGISPSSVSRWIAGKERPTVRLLERIAPTLQVDIRSLVALAYPEAVADDAPRREIPPLAAELGRMIGAESPLPEADQTYLRDMVDRLIAPYRVTAKRRRTA